MKTSSGLLASADRLRLLVLAPRELDRCRDTSRPPPALPYPPAVLHPPTLHGHSAPACGSSHSARNSALCLVRHFEWIQLESLPLNHILTAKAHVSSACRGTAKQGAGSVGTLRPLGTTRFLSSQFTCAMNTKELYSKPLFTRCHEIQLPLVYCRRSTCNASLLILCACSYNTKPSALPEVKSLERSPANGVGTRKQCILLLHQIPGIQAWWKGWTHSKFSSLVSFNHSETCLS